MQAGFSQAIFNVIFNFAYHDELIYTAKFFISQGKTSLFL